MSTTTATTPLVPPPTDRAPKMREPLTRRRRIRAWAMSALRDIVYAGAVFVWSIAAFILVTGVSVTASLLSSSSGSSCGSARRVAAARASGCGL
jgi:hypothetical protein